MQPDTTTRRGQAAEGQHRRVSAVAVGIRGYAGLALKAGSEQDAIAAALADCGARDRECRVIAIGMFSVEAK